MPSQHMLPKGKRRQSVKAEYRATRGVEEPGAPLIPTLELDPYTGGATPGHPLSVTVPDEARGLRLDQYLAQALPEISRSRVQLLIETGRILVNGNPARPKHKVAPGETLTLTGPPEPPPLQATAEDIPLDLVYEDDFLAIINKPAGMTVHAGAAKPATPDDHADDDTEDAPSDKDPRSAGTLVNALLHHFRGQLSSVGGELRPGIVHRLDKQTSGLLLVAKDDRTHTRLAAAFADRTVEKVYLALVHGHLRGRGAGGPAGADGLAPQDTATVNLPIGRDLVRRTRMTTRRPADAPGVRHAVSHIRVLERLDTAFGPFTLVEVRIETGRTHQIRVHLQALGHAVVGDTTYGAPAELHPLPALTAVPVSRRASQPAPAPTTEPLRLGRNFLHAARLSLTHPQTGLPLEAEAPLAPELVTLLDQLRAAPLTSPALPGKPPAKRTQ